MRPKYTIFIPAYKADNFINNICNNILRQVELPDQVLIVDDTMNSTNFFLEIKKKLLIIDKKIELNFVKNFKNYKPAKSWNRYKNMFRNNIVFRLDVDDFWDENHTSKMIDAYLLNGNYLLYAQKTKSIKTLFYNNDFLFVNNLIHSSCLFNLNKYNFTYPSCDYPYDDLKAFIKIKYILKQDIKILNFHTSKALTDAPNRWSDQNRDLKNKICLKRLFFLALKKKLNIKKINIMKLIKLLFKYDIFKSLFIFIKIYKNLRL
tara:strand:- start:4737 stop:5522 length:786 start_codon:yes stop_codon:yes gene_type:complete